MFLFPGFHHLSALQCEGLRIWDSACNRDFLSQLMLYPACANGPARLLTMSNFIGHQGKNGCCMQCPLKCHNQFLSSWLRWGSFMLATVNYDLYLFYCSPCSHSCPSNARVVLNPCGRLWDGHKWQEASWLGVLLQWSTTVDTSRARACFQYWQASSLTGDNANHIAWAWGGLGMRSCKLCAYREVAKGMVTQASWADVELWCKAR